MQEFGKDYLNTSHVKVKLYVVSSLFKYFADLNTSHVKVKQQYEKLVDGYFNNLNTSHVKVKQIL